MTGCEFFRDRLAARLDGELSPEDAAAVDEHLAHCAACQAEQQILADLDAQLAAWGDHHAEAACRIAAAVRLRAEPVPSARPTAAAAGPSPRLPRLLAVAVSALALALVLAVLRGPRANTQPDVIADSAAEPAPIVRITAATGPISLRTSAQEDWQFVSFNAPLGCVSGTSIRTADGALCELETESGAVVRLNALSTVTVESPTDLSLDSGEIYCSTGGGRELTVRARKLFADIAQPPDPKTLTSVADPLAIFACPSDSACMIRNDNREAETRASCEQGGMECVSPLSKTQILPGHTVVLKNGAFVTQAPDDLLLATSWIHPLLLAGAGREEEIQDRVHALLARVGQTKVSHLYEQQIRDLGEAGSWPLVRFLQSPRYDSPADRQKAARILRDTATVSMAGDLLGLLADDDPAVRSSLAAALQRLTGLHAALAPELWQQPDSRACRSAEQDWRSWWKARRP